MKDGIAIAVSLSEEAMLRTEALISEAEQGNYGALCDLLLYQSEAIRSGVNLTLGHAKFLAAVLREIAEGGDPRVAFKIKRTRGQKDRRRAVYAALCRVQSVKELQGSGKTLDDAIATVAKQTNASEDTVRAAWRDYRHAVQLRGHGFAFLYLTPKVRKPRPRARRRRSRVA